MIDILAGIGGVTVCLLIIYLAWVKALVDVALEDIEDEDSDS